MQVANFRNTFEGKPPELSTLATKGRPLEFTAIRERTDNPNAVDIRLQIGGLHEAVVLRLCLFVGGSFTLSRVRKS
jgi:hypothetical protein